MKMKWINASVLFSSFLLAGCPLTSEYEITITNNTQNQPMSPLALISSTQKGAIFKLAESASEALEYLAEGGNNRFLLQQAYDDPHNYDIVRSGAEGIAPGATKSYTVTRINPAAKYLSLATMLTRTNDGFIAEEVNLSKLNKGETYKVNARAWDAGTEQNTELAETLAGAEGFNSSREGDVDYIHTHPNVISNQDGLMDSALTASNRFIGPVASISIKRVK